MDKNAIVFAYAFNILHFTFNKSIHFCQNRFISTHSIIYTNSGQTISYEITNNNRRNIKSFIWHWSKSANWTEHILWIVENDLTQLNGDARWIIGKNLSHLQQIYGDRHSIFNLKIFRFFSPVSIVIFEYVKKKNVVLRRHFQANKLDLDLDFLWNIYTIQIVRNSQAFLKHQRPKHSMVAFLSVNLFFFFFFYNTHFIYFNGNLSATNSNETKLKMLLSVSNSKHVFNIEIFDSIIFKNGEIVVVVAFLLNSSEMLTYCLKYCLNISYLFSSNM